MGCAASERTKGRARLATALFVCSQRVWLFLLPRLAASRLQPVGSFLSHRRNPYLSLEPMLTQRHPFKLAMTVLNSRTSMGHSFQSCSQQTMRLQPTTGCLWRRKSDDANSYSIKQGTKLSRAPGVRRLASQSGKALRFPIISKPSSSATAPNSWTTSCSDVGLYANARS